MIGGALGPYRIDREIGVGGMGKVYAATLEREAAGLAPGTTVALKVSRACGDRFVEASVSANLGVALLSLGRLAAAHEHCRRALTLNGEVGSRLGVATAELNLGALRWEEGRAEDAESHLMAALAAGDEIGRPQLTCAISLAVGSLLAESGAGERGRELLESARDAARGAERPGVEALARCELALLPGGDASDALAAFVEHEERFSAEERRDARLLLWRATGDRAQIEEAKRLLDEALAKVPAEYHESMCQNLRVNREILAAWRAEFGDGESEP